MKPEGSLPCSQGPTPVSILSQINPAHTATYYFSNILCLPSGFFLSSFPTKPLCSSLHAALPSHLILLYLIIVLVYKKEYKLCNSLRNFLQIPLFYPPSDHILFLALRFQIPSIYVVRPSFTPIKTTEKLYFCIFYVLRF
jgi:hypothetical protein